MKLLVTILLAAVASSALALDNGLARTPPMGWMSWERFRCNVDCKDDPSNCISEQLYMDMADQFVEQGFKDVGYEYILVDDCWASKNRTASGQLQPDPVRFPHGMPYLVDYVHSKGLKLGLYGDMGTETCGGYPGSIDHLQTDADTLAQWGVDSWKMDGCYNPNQTDAPAQYQEFEGYLNKTGRPILFSCSYPAYWQGNTGIGLEIDYDFAASICNLWRLYDDIQDSWSSVEGIIDFWGDHGRELAASQFPGAYNDPDQLIIGDTALNDDESRTQMSLWAIWSAPLYMSNDLRSLPASAREILTNPEVIAINQDADVKLGYRIKRSIGEAWVKPLSNGDIAVALRNPLDSTVSISLPLTLCGVPSGKASVRDLWAHQNLGTVSGDLSAVNIPAHGTALYRITPQ